MMDWDRVRVFRGVAEAGSFTRAAESLGLSQSAISRQISALEEDLRTPLFHRHARGLVLTEQGEILLEARPGDRRPHGRGRDPPRRGQGPSRRPSPDQHHGRLRHRLADRAICASSSSSTRTSRCRCW